MTQHTQVTKFEINQVVRGKVAGEFIVLGFRNIAGEEYAQLKPYNSASCRIGRGELALPLTSILA